MNVKLAHALSCEPKASDGASREEEICCTAKGSICCVVEAHGVLPSLIKYLRVVHPKSAALLTHHSSLAVDEVDEMQLHRRAIVSALHSSSEDGSCRQSGSLWFTVLLSLLVLFLSPIPFQVLLCAGQGGQAATWWSRGTDPLSTQFHWVQMRWASGIFFFLYWKGKADTIITAFALAMHSNLFPFWLFNTVDRWCLKCVIAHNFSSTLWIAQSFFFLSVSSSGYRDASIPSKYAKNVELYFVLLN